MRRCQIQQSTTTRRIRRRMGRRAVLPVVASFVVLFGSTMAAERRAIGAETGASVEGVVKFDGSQPKRRSIQMKEKGGKLSDCHKLHKAGLLDENLLVGDKGELANVFVYVRKGLEKGKEYPAAKKPAVLNQKNCMFYPRVQGVRVGQDFVMKNGDPVLHNVRSFSFRNRAFNVAQPAKSEDRKKVFKYREKAVMIQCDLHPWMKAYFFVMDHPYFAVTDEKGRFKIDGLPAGEYTLSAWHEEFGEQQATVKVGSTGSTEVGFSFKEKKKAE